jgi:hypothetical protein
MPWTQTGCGDAEYLAASHLLLLPVARAFDPQLVLISAGFDAADGDVQGGMRVSPWGFAQMTAAFASLGKPMALALEGGYNQEVTATCVVEVTRALLGDVPVLSALECAARASVSAHGEQQLRAAIAVHRQYWPAVDTDEHLALVEHFFERSRRNAGAQRTSQRTQVRPPQQLCVGARAEAGSNGIIAGKPGALKRATAASVAVSGEEDAAAGRAEGSPAKRAPSPSKRARPT